MNFSHFLGMTPLNRLVEGFDKQAQSWTKVGKTDWKGFHYSLTYSCKIDFFKKFYKVNMVNWVNIPHLKKCALKELFHIK